MTAASIMCRFSDCLPYDDVAGACSRCGEALTGRRTRWCSDECSEAHWADHVWQVARKRALRRDNATCQACGYQGREHALDGERVMEVNHIEPLRGRGYLAGCHHLDNLETLCRPCHRAVTTAQQRARASGDDDRIDSRALVA